MIIKFLNIKLLVVVDDNEHVDLGVLLFWVSHSESSVTTTLLLSCGGKRDAVKWMANVMAGGFDLSPMMQAKRNYFHH